MFESEASRFRGLVIGVDRYPQLKQRQQLHGCVNDALAFHDFLIDRLNVPVEHLELAISPQPERKPSTDDRSTTARAIREAFARLIEHTRSGDEVIVYYAGHGARVSNSATNEYLYGFVPSDATISPSGLTNLILGREVNQLARSLVKRGANPTIVLDTCHSGGSVRASNEGTERRLLPESGDPEWRVSPAAWEAFKSHYADASHAHSARADEAHMRNWVMLAACRDIEVARECSWPGSETRGVFTTCLLAELALVPKDAIDSLRWCDLMPSVQRAVRSRASQRPIVEGRAERAVFGGAWRSEPRGFRVGAGAEPNAIEIAAGMLHGLDVGAEVSIGNVIARIESATPASSFARSESALAVTSASRAVLIAPSPQTVRTRALVTGLPIELSSREPLLTIVDGPPADVAIRPLRNREWVMVPYEATLREPTRDDVIANLGESTHEAFAARAEAGLAHWARFRSIRDRSAKDATLFNLVEVALRIGKTIEESSRCQADSTGIHHVKIDQPLWVEMKIRPRPEDRPFLGVLLCSDDGNVIPLWPPSGGSPTPGARGADENLPDGQTIYIGEDQHAPAYPTIEDDRDSSMYTFKVIACALSSDAESPDLSVLALSNTVQDAVDSAKPGRTKDVSPETDQRSVSPRWCTWDLVVRVSRR